MFSAHSTALNSSSTSVGDDTVLVVRRIVLVQLFEQRFIRVVTTKIYARWLAILVIGSPEELRNRLLREILGQKSVELADV